MVNRSREYRRYIRKKAIKRKKHIINSYRADNPPAYGKENGISGYGQCDPYWYINHEGKLAKGKIHCSCPICAFHGITRQDIKVLMHMNDELVNICDEINKEMILCNIKQLRSKIKKKINGRYYPKAGFKGTRIGVDNKINIDEFNSIIASKKERK